MREKLTDPTEAYEAGFRLAVNYLYSILPNKTDQTLSKNSFAQFVANNFNNLGVDPDFFKNNPIEEGDGSYPVGLCPGPNGTCIECPSFGLNPTND